jgi:hypothetical protein
LFELKKEGKDLKNKPNTRRKCYKKDQLMCTIKNGTALKAGGKEEGKEEQRKKNEEGLANSGLCTKCHSFINSQKCKKDLSVYNALKSHRRKKEMNSTHLLMELPLKKKKTKQTEADKCC